MHQGARGQLEHAIHSVGVDFLATLDLECWGSQTSAPEHDIISTDVVMYRLYHHRPSHTASPKAPRSFMVCA